MPYMLCRNRVKDFEHWKKLFLGNLETGLQAGLKLLYLWQEKDDPNNVFFIFEVGDMEKARAFISAPEAEKMGKISGVVDGEVHFVEEAGGY